MKKQARHTIRGDWFLKLLKKNWLTVIFLLIWIGYFTYFWSNSIILTSEGNLAVRNVNLWGDWAAHFTLGSSFAYRDGFPESSPFLLGAPLSYPFLVNYLSGMLIRAGAPFFAAFVVPSWFFSILIGAALLIFYRVMLKEERATILATIFFVLNGGIGFLSLFKFLDTQPWYEILLNPPLRVTNIEPELIRWISIVPSMIIPQRAFVMGFPLAVLVLAGSYYWLMEGRRLSKKSIFALGGMGVISGLLILIHTHSFLAVFVIVTCWSIVVLGKMVHEKTSNFHKSPLLGMITFGVITAVVAIPLWLLFFQNHIATQESFIKWYPGWYSNENDIGWIEFWFKNWGVVPLFAVAGLLTKIKRKDNTWTLWIPFFVLFAMVNLVLWQPFIWDNTKLLVWASLGFSGLAGYFIATILENIKSHSKPRALVNYLFLTFLLFFSWASGAVDVWRTIRFDLNTHTMYSAVDLRLANWVKENTAPNSNWVTPNYHNQWLFNLTGRQTLMAYPGWLWTHGYHYMPTQQQLEHIYADPAENLTLLKEKNINYLIYQQHSDNLAPQEEFDALFTLVHQDGEYLIYSMK